MWADAGFSMSAGRRASQGDGSMSANNEQLAFHFVELLADKAMHNGQAVPRWITLPPAWRRIYAETVAVFLEGLGYRVIADGRIDERQEDEQIRLFCENLTRFLFCRHQTIREPCSARLTYR
jgi:hypothetical protein